ncbi:MAG TPA: LON peptidase substrate-binding domain-containing protein [Candidatus Omnitrophota bacterium]|nr:LON peptidase substrate-binding domain-containing protein [Candidatus Omnitrophota bacterium]
MAAGVENLPAVVPVFAVSGALLLPGARVPLTVFEPRYLAMTDDCLGAGRLFALVQPRADGKGTAPGLYDVGCLARIVAFGETGDGRYLITALGLNRFRVAGEAEGRSGYRRVQADYAPFAADGGPKADTAIDRHRLVNAVATYLHRHGVKADLAKLDPADDGEVVTALAMAAPLSPEEKQALLEAPTIADRAQLMIAMFEMALLAEDGGHMPVH